MLTQVQFTELPEKEHKDKVKFVNIIRSLFCNYFADLFKNYEKYYTPPDNVLDWDINEVFDQREFLEKEDSKTDFYKDFFMTRTWMIFLESKITPETVSQVQLHKHFGECILKIKGSKSISVNNNIFNDSEEEEKEYFEYPFVPEKYMNISLSFQKAYIETRDNRH